MFGHSPDGTSSRVLAHMAQRVVRNTFSFYDFGPKTNLQIYKSTEAPIYNLSKIISPFIILISGKNDYLADEQDIDTIRKQLTGNRL